ncbi:nucleoprotein [Universidad Nacional virus 1]|uniref:Nucleoprotein n=1 Tax=Universidad Nacional virus 1 TaxID=2970745 RepID=A0AAX3C0L1_9VIRU|nr:nucleoprotein [Universidad Nacional virus 1]UUM00587.1 nucleoprotein [Universidad Nacional virus 1]
MSSNKDLVYESVKELHGKYGIEENVIDELRHIWDGLTEELIQSCNSINHHFRNGGDAQSIGSELIRVNEEIRKLHTNEFVEPSVQIPVVISTKDISLSDLIELRNDVKLIKEKTQTNQSKGTGTEKGWKKFIYSSVEDLIIFTQTGYLDEKYLRKQGNGKLAGFMAKQHGMTKDCKHAAKLFKTVKEDVFDFEDTPDQEILTNQLQVDYLFLIVYTARKQSMSIESLLEMSERCKLIFNRLPFTSKVQVQLSKSSKYPVLREIETNLSLYDSPFRMNRARFQSSISAITGCTCDRMISSKNVPQLLTDLLGFKHRDNVTVTSSPGSTNTYELLLHSVLTTPNVNSKLKNRTNVKKNGLNTVKFVEETDSEELNLSSQTKKGNIKVFKIEQPKNLQLMKYTSNTEKELTQGNKLIVFIDIEGSPSEPNEVAVGCFFQRVDGFWMREVVFYSSTPGKDYIQQAQYCNGLNLNAIEDSGKQSNDIFRDVKLELDTYSAVYFSGKDVEKFLDLCSFKGAKHEINLPEWKDRAAQGYQLIFPSKVCNKAEFHNIKLKAKEKDVQLKQLPHCASEDNIRMFNFTMNN